MTYELLGTSSRPVRVFLLVNVRLYRDGIIYALSQCADVEVVGAAETLVPGFMQQIQARVPDVLLVEASMIRNQPDIAATASTLPSCRVVAFGLLDDDRDIIECVEHGVAGFISRDGTPEQLVKTILNVSRGEFMCSPRDVALLMQRIRTSSRLLQGLDGPAVLTSREQQVVALVDEGLSNKDIASRLGIELSTVKNHIHNVLSKLHATRRSQAAARMRSSISDGRPVERIDLKI